MQVDGGYLQDEGVRERYKRLSIPVRRALNGSDRASFVQAIAAIETGRRGRRSARPRRSRLAEAAAGARQHGGPGRRESGAASDSAAAGSTPPRSTTSSIAIAPTTSSIDRLGKAAEGMGAQLMEDAARVLSCCSTKPPPPRSASPSSSRRRRRRRRRHPIRRSHGGNGYSGRWRQTKTELISRASGSSPCPRSYLNMFFATNQTFAGRSASRRMYHGNQYSP